MQNNELLVKLTAQTCYDPMYIAGIYLIASVVVMEVVCVYAGIFILWGRGNKKVELKGKLRLLNV